MYDYIFFNKNGFSLENSEIVPNFFSPGSLLNNKDIILGTQLYKILDPDTSYPYTKDNMSAKLGFQISFNEFFRLRGIATYARQKYGITPGAKKQNSSQSLI